MAKKLLAMVLGLTMMIGAAGCSAVDTGSEAVAQSPIRR